MEKKCKHGLDQRYCALCQPRQTRTNFPRYQKVTIRPRKEYTPTPTRSSHRGESQIYVVSTAEGRHGQSFIRMSENIRFVHIDGFPFLWAIKLILERCQNLESIEVTPLYSKKLGPRHHQLCQERGVQLVQGYRKAKVAEVWQDRKNPVHHSYGVLRAFLFNLNAEKKSLFEELLSFGFEEAQITARYFCLQEEPYMRQRELAQEYGYKS